MRFITCSFLACVAFGEPCLASVLQPRHEIICVPTEQVAAKWDYQITDSQDLVQETEQAGFRELARGNGQGCLYAIFEKDKNILIVVVPDRGGSFSSESFKFLVGDNDHSEASSTLTAAVFITTDVLVDESGLKKSTFKQSIPLLGCSINCDKGFPASFRLIFHGKSRANVCTDFDKNISLIGLAAL